MTIYFYQFRSAVSEIHYLCWNFAALNFDIFKQQKEQTGLGLQFNDRFAFIL